MPRIGQMISAAAILFGTFAVAHADAPAARELTEPASFDRLMKGEIDSEFIFLGFNPDGSRFAYVRSGVEDPSERRYRDIRLVQVATGQTVSRFQLDEGKSKAKSQRRKHDEFLASLKQVGVSRENQIQWKRDGAQFISPDGKLRIAGGFKTEKSNGSWISGRVFVVTLEDGGADRSVLFEAFEGKVQSPRKQDQLELLDVFSSKDQRSFVVTMKVDDHFMCWDNFDFAAKPFVVEAIRSNRPAREHNARGMQAYDAGSLQEAQKEFRDAIGIDPNYFRARYNLAATSARLKQDGEVLKLVKDLVKTNQPLTLFKVVTDADFTDARRRSPLKQYLEQMKVDLPIEVRAGTTILPKLEWAAAKGSCDNAEIARVEDGDNHSLLIRGLKAGRTSCGFWSYGLNASSPFPTNTFDVTVFADK